MIIAVGSAFRNSAGHHLARYAHHLNKFKQAVECYGHEVIWIASEGDSRDNTRMELQHYSRYLQVPLRLAIREHGGPEYGSTEAPARMKALSYVGNGILESVGPNVDVLVYIESDLLWDPDTILRLIARLGDGVDVVSPLIFAGKAFYDIWAFRKDGERFGPFAPYHAGLQNHGSLTPVDSVGSCLIMKGEVARRCRIINDEALVGFCADVRAKGYKIFVDAAERVDHPA